ncbi:MAG: flagellar hook-length control protein FliK [Mesorhizobium sp.]
MKVSADPAISAPVSSGRGGRQAADDAAETGFDHVLRNTGKEHPTKARQAAEATPRQPLWPDFAARLADKATETDPEHATSSRDDAGEPTDDDPKTGGSKAKQSDKHQPQAQGLPQMLTALPGPHRHITADPDGKDTATASASAQPDSESALKLPATEGGLPAPDRATSTAAPLPTIKGVTEAASATPPNGTKPAMLPPGNTAKDAGPLPPISTQAAGVGEEAAQPSAPSPDPAAAGKKPEAAIEAQSVKHSAAADKPAASASHVTVTGAQSFPAPAPHPASQTVTGLASAIAADNGARQVLSASAGLAQPAPSVALPSHILKIELHPAELGTVTASLRLAGGQLSIELKPENHEAHRKLSSDTDGLIKSLQGMGFNVDKVTVLQPAIAVNATPRTDAASPAGRDPSSFQPGNSGGNNGASGGQQSGRNHGNDGQNSGRSAPHPRERIGGDLFI